MVEERIEHRNKTERFYITERLRKDARFRINLRSIFARYGFESVRKARELERMFLDANVDKDVARHASILLANKDKTNFHISYVINILNMSHELKREVLEIMTGKYEPNYTHEQKKKYLNELQNILKDLRKFIQKINAGFMNVNVLADHPEFAIHRHDLLRLLDSVRYIVEIMILNLKQ